jgi:hypothetical protein
VLCFSGENANESNALKTRLNHQVICPIEDSFVAVPRGRFNRRFHFLIANLWFFTTSAGIFDEFPPPGFSFRAGRRSELLFPDRDKRVTPESGRFCTNAIPHP